MLDASLIIRTTADDLDATESPAVPGVSGTSTAIVDLGPGGTGIDGLELVVNFPTVPTDADETCIVEIRCADTTAEIDGASADTTAEVKVMPIVTKTTQANPGVFGYHFTTLKRYVGAKFTLAGTTPNFGKVGAYIGRDTMIMKGRSGL